MPTNEVNETRISLKGKKAKYISRGKSPSLAIWPLLSFPKSDFHSTSCESHRYVAFLHYNIIFIYKSSKLLLIHIMIILSPLTLVLRKVFSSYGVFSLIKSFHLHYNNMKGSCINDPFLNKKYIYHMFSLCNMKTRYKKKIVQSDYLIHWIICNLRYFLHLACFSLRYEYIMFLWLTI